MKRTIILSFCFTAIIPFTASAKIWRVNNNAGITADFTTAQDAHDGASAGDTIHFEPSINTYGVLTMSKRLVLIGIGDFTSATSNVQASVIIPKLSNLTINVGADNSLIMVNVTGPIILPNNGIYNGSGSATNVQIKRCHFWSLEAHYANLLTILDCYVDYSIKMFITTGVTISNNILIGGGEGVTIDNASSASISNNYIGCIVLGYNMLLQNNIINFAGSTSFQNCTIKNNIFSPTASYNATVSTVTGNLTNIDMSTVLINGGSLSNTTADAGFQLLAGSPAIGAGVGGVDCGAFGGLTPYKLALQPPVPAIYKVSAPASVSNTLTLTISTKSNN
jgi:hypothetical protein